MIARTSLCFCCGLFLAGMSQVEICRAAPPAEAETAEVKAPTTDELTEWVRQLESNEFATRRQATEKLIAAGAAAVEPVAAAANTDDLEVATRCIAILGELLKSADKSTSDSARKALERLAESERKSVARRARSTIAPAETGEPDQVVGGFNVILRGNVQLAPGAGQVFRIQTRNINGNKEVEVDDNGKKIRIQESPGKGIQISVTETVDGKEKVSKYEAKDVDDLKAKHPEGHALYEKYGKDANAGMQMQVLGGNGMIRLQAAPALPAPFAPPAPANNTEAARKAVEAARDRLEQAGKALRNLADKENPAPTADDLKRLAREIEDATRELDRATKSLGGRE